MSRRLEALVVRDALAWTLVAGGALWLATTLLPPWEPGAGYLPGVLSRSLAAPYQSALLSGLVALPVHAAWTWGLRRGTPGAAVAYDAFGLWAQTLFTSLGFLGTIVGVSLAVAGLESAMEAGEPGALIAGLSTAFDTTFLGLAAALLLMALRQAARLGAAP